MVDLSKLKRKNIAVIGDSMLDEYYYVTANRISPEFPIPVSKTNKEEPDITRPGGAANVCYQLKNFDVGCNLYSIVDSKGFDFIINNGFDASGCFMPHKAIMPRKKRYYNGTFPLYRWDVEDNSYGLNQNDFKEAVKKVYYEANKDNKDVIICSDYNKGMFSTGLDMEFNCRTIVDPKCQPISRWKNCTIFKPNQKEAYELSGLTDWKQQCDYFQKELNCCGVVITCGENGVACKFNEYFYYKILRPINPDNFIGAGDCFAAFLAYALANDYYYQDCVSIAAEAASAFGEKKLNDPITPRELAARFDPRASKMVDVEDLLDRTYKLVFTNGCFDVFHYGHLSTLREASKFGDKLVVALNTDESIKRIKGEDRPVHCLKQRKDLIAALDFVDYVIDFNEDSPYEVLRRLKPEVLVKGGDYSKEDVIGREFSREVEIVPFLENLSTTRILNEF